MKVLHICAVGFTVENTIHSQVDYLLSKNLSIEIACSPGSEVERLKQQGYIIHPVKIDRRISPVSNLSSIIKLAKLMRQQRYDAVHVHTPIASVLSRIAAKFAGIKTTIYTVHGFYFHDLTPMLEYRIFHAIEVLTAKITDMIFSVSYEDINTIKCTHLCPLEKVRYLGGIGVDLNRFNPQNLDVWYQQALKKSLGIPDAAFPILGTVGRLTKKKGSADLVEALEQLKSEFPNAHALIIGGELSSDPDPFQTELVEKINSLGLQKNVTLTGYRSDIPELLALMDIFVLPTYTHEGLPTVIVEAMAMEKPVVATNVRGCREAVVDGLTGLIIPPQNPDALAVAIKSLLNDPEKRHQMGVSGRKRVEAEYDVHLVHERLASGYQELGLLPN